MINDWQKAYGLDIEFFDAFDRRLLPQKALLPFDEALSLKYSKRLLTNGEIACITSQYLLILHLLDKGYEQAIIMEDDIYPPPGAFTDKEDFFAQIHYAASAFPHVMAIIMHDHSEWEIQPRIQEEKTGCRLVGIPPFGARMVWYNRAGLTRMHRYLLPIRVPADNVYRHFFPKYTVATLAKPLAAHYTQDSYIENSRFKVEKRRYIP